jgi:gas vesicle protein
MSGQASTLGQGDIAALGSALALTGQVITSAQQALEASQRGLQATFGQGSVAQVLSVALTGEASTSATGTVVNSSGQQTLTGEGITSAQGAVSASGNDVTAHLSGVEADFAAGTVDGGSTVISGLESVSAAGTAAADLTVALTGESATLSAGTMVPSQDAVDTLITSEYGSAVGSSDVALTGTSSTLGQGTVTPTGDAFGALTGSAATAEAGSVAFEQSYALTGTSSTLSQGAFGAPGGAALTGSVVTVNAGEVFTSNDRTFALTGESITSQDGACFASSLAFPPGVVLTVSQETIGPKNAALTGQSIGAVAGDIHAPGRSGQTPAGRGRRRRKTEVEIDGQVYTVETKEDAARLLESAKQAAEEVAALTIERASKAERRPTRKVLADARKALQVPVIDADEDLKDQVQALQQEIADIYTQALQTVEIAALMRKAEIEEDDEDVLLLLS